MSAAARGELRWHPLALFRALLLTTWHDLSDVRPAEAPGVRTSFRRFCGFGPHEFTLARIAFVRFRRVLVRLCRPFREQVSRVEASRQFGLAFDDVAARFFGQSAYDALACAPYTNRRNV